jgi:hypothetical protein
MSPGPGLALGPTEHNTTLTGMYRRLVVVLGCRNPFANIVGIATGVYCSWHTVKPDTPAMPLAHQLRACLSLTGALSSAGGSQRVTPSLSIDGFVATGI